MKQVVKEIPMDTMIILSKEIDMYDTIVGVTENGYVALLNQHLNLYYFSWIDSTISHWNTGHSTVKEAIDNFLKYKEHQVFVFKSIREFACWLEKRTA